MCASGGAGKNGSSIQSLIKGGKNKWSYTDSELRKLAKAHQNGDATLKKQIEDRLTDINFHTEANSFREGTYTLLSSIEPQISFGASASPLSNFYRGISRARTSSRGRTRG